MTNTRPRIVTPEEAHAVAAESDRTRAALAAAWDEGAKAARDWITSGAWQVVTMPTNPHKYEPDTTDTPLTEDQVRSLACKHIGAARNSEALLGVTRLRTTPEDQVWLTFHHNLAIWHREQARALRNRLRADV